MIKNVEDRNRVTEPVDLRIAEQTESLLSNLVNDFEDLRKCIRNYIPDYAVKHEQIYSLEDICKIYSLCDNINKNRFTLSCGISYHNRDDSSKIEYTTPVKWCKTMKCLTDSDEAYIDNYLERFNCLNHILSATRTLNVETHNAIHTVFKNVNGGALSRVCAILSKAKDITHEFTRCVFAPALLRDHSDYVERWRAFTDYFIIRGYKKIDDEEFAKLYIEWTRDKDAKKRTFCEWVRTQDIRNQSEETDKPCIECADDFNTYCEYRWVVEDDEQYDKLFEDWLKNFKSEVPFGVYLVENGYFIDSKKPKQKKKVKSATEPEVRS